ncbi:MAG: magnesium/cobalt transporter CorA [candidate division Zixibacteria bacterium]|nr:magnesium/cobalt transporter CorA [candidate division Zixibacteria bacterium]
MALGIKRVRKKAGLQPGAMVFSGPERTHPVRISILHYADSRVDESKNVAVEEALMPFDRPGVTWIDLNGIHDTTLVETIGKHFSLHPLVLEDLVTTGQRPKLEDYGDYLFLTIKRISLTAPHKTLGIEELSIIVGRNYVLTFQETEEDSFTAVKDRLRKGTDRFLKSGTDYLAYALVDMVVDNYFAVLEELGEQFEQVQNQVLASPTPMTLRTVYRLKNDLIMMRRSIWPLRDVIIGMQRNESPLITHATALYLRDVQDHTVQIMDTIETLRDMLAGTLDIYMSSVSNRMNQVMKILTMIATIFIPLTFVVGIYGMNFDFMPELHWQYGYPLIMGVMFLVVVVMLWWFRRNKWW